MPDVDLDSRRWQRLKPLLTEALRLPTDERDAFFARHLGSDVTLRSSALEMARLYDRAAHTFPAAGGEAPTSSDVASRVIADLKPGDAVGHYRVIRKLGEGGMGRVYLAEDQRLGRRVALKRLDPSALPSSDNGHARAIAESRSIAILNHPGIVVLYDVFEAGGELVLAMEHVEGRPLSAHAAAGPMPTGFALRLMAQVADAVAYAHARGVLHCDLKPSNIHVLPNGTAKVLDFGLARIVTTPQADVEVLAPRVIGTPGYLSPEQLCLKPPGPASDVYALGVVLFELLTGAPVFNREDRGQLLLDTVMLAPPAPSSIVPSLPAGVDDLVGRCLAKEPRERLQAHELATALRDLAAQTDGTMPAPGKTPDVATGHPSTGGRRWLAAGAVAAAGLAIWLVTQGTLSSIRWPWAAPSPSSNPALPVSLAILPTVGTLPRNEDTALGKALPALLRPALSRIHGLNVVLLDEESSAPGAPPQAALRNLGATLAVRCVLRSGDGQDVVDVELFGADNPVRLAHAGVTVDRIAPARTFEQVVSAVQQALATRLPQAVGTAGKTIAAVLPSPLALSHFSEGLEMLERPDVPGNVARAITLLESATAKDPLSAVAHAALARAYWLHYVDTRDEDAARKAQAAVMTALTRDNTLVSVKLSAAIIQRGMGEAERAERTLTDVIAEAPASDEAHRLLGEVLAARGQLARANEAFDKSIALRPLYWRNHRAKGLGYYNAGDFEHAAASFVRVTELQPDSAWGYQMLGTALHQRGNYAGAVAAYEKALSLGPTPAAWSNIGKLHYDNGQYEKAVHAYKEAIKIRSGSALTWRNLGDVLSVLGRNTEARAAYQQAEEFATRTTRVNPTDAAAVSTLAVIHAKLGRTKEAIAEADKAAGLAPRDRTVQYRRAVVLMLAGDRVRAQAAIDEAVRLGFSVSEAKLDRDLKGLKLATP